MNAQRRTRLVSHENQLKYPTAQAAVANTPGARRSGVGRTRFAAILLAACLLAQGAFVLAAPAASAASPKITTTANVRSCVNTANTYCSPFAKLTAGTPVTMACWYDGSTATGNYTSNRWFLVRRGDGFEGFVHSSLVGSQVSSPWCGNVTRVKAGLQAIARLGQVYASSSDASRYSDWAPGPYAEWSGDCKKFVAIAYYRAGLTLVSGNAKPTFDYYRANRTQKGGGFPRYGALVGFNITLPYGHIAVAIGGDRIATTQGYDGNKLPTAIRTTSSYSNYAGWVVP